MAAPTTKRKHEPNYNDGENTRDTEFKDILIGKHTDVSLGEESDEESVDSYYSGLDEEPDTGASSADSDEHQPDQSSPRDSETRISSSQKNVTIREGNIASTEHIDLSKTSPMSPEQYSYDSSDEEDIRNTIGNVPLEWYGDFLHLGYSLDGQKILKPAGKDELDQFLNKMDNPNYWRTVHDRMTGEDLILSAEDLQLVDNIVKQKYPDTNYNPNEPAVDFFTHETMIHPVTNRAEHKRSFIPSKWERLKVGRLVHAIKMGWIKSKPEVDPSVTTSTGDDDEQMLDLYMLWDDENIPEFSRRHHVPATAPKLKLPGHGDSYNPPPEYLDPQELMSKQKKDPEGRFIPRRFDSLRKVPAYKRFISERFERCLDLYLCPRKKQIRPDVDAEDLIPQLPKPKDLQPFPSQESIVYIGHKGIVRTISIGPMGQWLVTGSDDGTIRFWEILTGRCVKVLPVSGGTTIHSIAWSPSRDIQLIAAAIGDNVYLINPGLGDRLIVSNTDSLLSSGKHMENSADTPSTVKWIHCSASLFSQGYRLFISHLRDVRQICWHNKGDYFASVVPDGGNQAVVIHQLSKQLSQYPFTKSKGLVQKVLFHPSRPYLFVATQRYIRMYNLTKQELSKKLYGNCKWISSIAIHPGGDNIIMGSFDCRLSWFDMDLSSTPYQTLRHHKKAIRQVAFHRRYPLFASCSDDGTAIVCHGMVYSDLLQNPLIVPVKILRGHNNCDGLGIIDCTFHTSQPWLFTAGPDGTVRLFTN